MKRHNKITFGLLVGGAITGLGLIGSTAGSLAWYAYSRSVRVNFIGTSIANSAFLHVGLVDDSHYLSDEKVASYKLVREEYDNHSIVFSRSTDGLDYHVLQDYLFRSDYAVNLLFPLTTQSRTLGDQSNLKLYESPLHGDPVIDDEAKKSHYVRLPFAFRMVDSDGHLLEEDVWLTSSNVQASGKNIDQSLRIFIENSQRKFLMKPSDKSTSTGTTKVGGILDLDGDGTYDYDLGTKKELYYGQYTGNLVYSDEEYGISQATAPYDNVNGVTDTTESTFYSKHNEEAYVIDQSKVTPKVVEYHTLGTVRPSVDSDGKYYEGATGIKMTTTNSEDGIGYVTFTIFIEGWDHVVVDKAANYSFNLSLKFEVNRD